MSNLAPGKNRFRKRKVVTATGQSDLVVCLASPGYSSETYAVATAPSGAAVVALVISGLIPKWIPRTGNLQVTTNAGTILTIAYSAYNTTTSTFTIAATNFDANPTAVGSAVRLPMAYRCVLTAWQIIGHNTNAAASGTTFTVRNKATTTSVLLGGSIMPATGSLAVAAQERCIPGEAGETIEISVGGAITGQIEFEVEGEFVAASVALANEYTGVP